MSTLVSCHLAIADDIIKIDADISGLKKSLGIRMTISISDEMKRGICKHAERIIEAVVNRVEKGPSDEH